MKILITATTPLEALAIVSQEARRQASRHRVDAEHGRLVGDRRDSTTSARVLDGFAAFIDSISMEDADAASQG